MVMILDIFLIILMAGAAFWTVMTRSLLRAAIGLALTSVIVAILMFRLDSPLAAVFELSVCTGLISVLFISAIGLTQSSVREETHEFMIERLKRFRYLPIVMAVLAIALSFVSVKLNIKLPQPELETDARAVMWSLRPLDVIGQVVILLSGVFGVIILFKEADKR